MVASHQNDVSKDIALMEAKIEKLCEILSEVNRAPIYLFTFLFYQFFRLIKTTLFLQTIAETKRNTDRKQALNYDEMEAEREQVRSAL